MPTWKLYEGDCLEVMRQLPDNSVDAVVTDPPYGLEFMGKEWDAPWLTGVDFTRPGIGDRRTAWPSFTGTSGPFGGANPTCAVCGGRARGSRKCKCDDPDWRVKGEKPDPMYARTDQMRTFQDWCQRWATEVLRVLKPGGHILAFGGTRTYHRLACAIEDAGFEVRDCLMWLYGSGFPKSLDVSKAIDKMLGAEREVVGPNPYSSPGRKPGVMHIAGGNQRPAMEARMAEAGLDKPPITAPATPEAKQWEGWGTALKPAYEPVILARKPLSEKNVAANVLRWGTGALNIDGCRIRTECEKIHTPQSNPEKRSGTVGRDFGITKSDKDRFRRAQQESVAKANELGRFPANILLDEEAAALLDEQSGIRQGGARPARRGPGTKGYHGWPNGTNDGVRIEYEGGGASRFFYVAKASRSERTMGGKVENNHPTVKPIKLMRYLCRLITPPGGLILDPFAGSGTTLLAAIQEGFSCIGIEKEPEYCAIIRARMAEVQPALPLEVS